MKKEEIKSIDRLRKKVDGFSLNEADDKVDNCYKTTDQGVYFSPDSHLDMTNDKSK